MPLFKCDRCHAIENTAMCNHAVNRYEGRPVICSECETGTWHGRFPKQHAAGMHLASDGFLYSDAALEQATDRFARQRIRVVGVIQPNGTMA